MNPTRFACCALSASALFLAGILFQSFASPPAAQAATVNWQGSATVATAKIQANEDGLYVLVGDTLSLYRTNMSNKKLELLRTQKFSFSGGKAGTDSPVRGGR